MSSTTDSQDQGTTSDSGTNSDTGSAPPAPPISTGPDNAVAILSEVASHIKESTPVVRAALVEALVEKEVKSRVEQLSKALEERMSASGELNKIKADNIAYDENGKEIGSSWTKDQAKKLKEAKEKLTKIDKKIELALGGDWSKIKGG